MTLLRTGLASSKLGILGLVFTRLFLEADHSLYIDTLASSHVADARKSSYTSWTHVANKTPSLLNILCMTTPRPSPAHGLSISVNIHSSALTSLGSWK